MALPVYDSSKHHVGLGTGTGDDLKGFFVKGYTKQRQRETDRIVQEFGGGRDDIGTPGHSRWNQDSFIGGGYQYRVDPQDLARFAASENLIPMLQGQGAISVPPVMLAHSFNPLGASYTSHLAVSAPTYVEPKNMFAVAGSLYIVFKHAIFRYITGTGALTSSVGTDSGDLGEYLNIADAAYDQNEQIYWCLLGPGATDTTSILRRFRHDFEDPNVGPNYFSGPLEMEDMEARGMAIWGPTGEIIVSIAQRLFTFLPPKQITNSTGVDDGKWTDRGRLPGRWVDSLAYNNRLYILCNEADGQTHLVCWDGVDVLPVCTFSFEFEGWSLVDYGGRIFVVGRGTDVNGGDRYAELHEVTGASNRLVRTFQPEHYFEYAGSETPKNFKCVMVMDGLLWMPHQGRRLIAYDLTADAFWGASEFPDVGENFTLHEMSRGRGGLYAYGSTNGVNSETGLYRIALNTDVPPEYSCVLETSDFDVRPSRKKRWSHLLVRTRNQTSATIEYSLDSGTDWTALSVTTTNDADVNEHECDLSGIPVSKRIRFRFTFPQGTDTSYLVMELLSFSCSFIFLDTNKWAWGLTLISTDKIETYEDTAAWAEETYSVDEIADSLASWCENTTALVFKDLDLAERKVQIIDLKQNLPVIAPRQGGNVEAFFTLTLQEV